MRVILNILLLAAFCGCTHNNGYIGPLFGNWVLSSMTVDGAAFDPHEADTFMQFQGDIVMTKLIDDRHTQLTYSVGTWERDDRTLILDYRHSDNEWQPGTGIYRAPEWLLLESNAINTLEILTLDKKQLRLRYLTPQGQVVNYSFRKTF